MATNPGPSAYVMTGEEMASQRGIWGPIFNWIREDTTLAEWLDDGEEAKFLNNDPLMYELWSVFTQYQGFDIKTILKHMKSNYEAYMENREEEHVSENILVNGVQKTFRYTNKETMARDITFILLLFSNRGSTWEKIIEKSDVGVGSVLTWMQEKYQLDITIHAPGTSLPPSTITIPRIAACFPIKMCELMVMNHGKRYCTLSQLGLENIMNINTAILSPFFTSVIPSSWCKEKQAPHIFSFLTHVYLDNTIHKKEKKYTSLDEMFTYYAAAFRTPGVPERTRISFITKSGWREGNSNSFKTSIIIAIPTANELLRTLRGDDDQINQVIEDLSNLVS